MKLEALSWVEILEGGPDAELLEHPGSGSYIGDQAVPAVVR